jgi:hypothetical protein
MSRRYTVSRTAVTPTVGNDLLTLVVGTGRRVRVWEISITGAHTTAAPVTVEAGRSTGGTTPGANLTAAAQIPGITDTTGVTVPTTWAAQPTLATEGRLQLGCNALGGNYRWTAFHADHAFEVGPSGQFSVRPSLGTNPLNVHVVYEEI